MEGGTKTLRKHTKKTTMSTNRIHQRLFKTMVNMGWNKVKLAKILRDIDTDTLQLFHENYSIEDQVKTVILGLQDHRQDTYDIQDTLVSLGMRVPMARKYSKMMQPLLNEYGMPIIIEMVIEHALGNYMEQGMARMPCVTAVFVTKII